MREAISLTEEQTLVTQGIKAEQDFRNSVGTLTRKVRLNPDLKAYGEAARAVPFPAEILGDIPSYLNQDEQEAMTYLGWGPEHAMWKEIADKTREGKANKSLSQDDMTGLLENIEKSAPRLDYSLSPSHLHQNGILTIGGNDWLDDLIALAIFIFIVLPWLFWQFVYSNSPWIVDYILHTFGFGD